ncbi:cytochrome b/b6 domain-containing protein [Massilia sp. CCM 9210]|uniref:cytochrome b/b6 domain-containing protein n=1 Tax=Massilia scottii TaxID=3057166 RepID=UPI0027969CAA|nr:cytochrome b/b6 domain-containing protein [Massilia sp. CCM 9210]MDQ1814527.1 cytochrome b/b6 domain-containing protein [Massilia sp. CCM 9210]
MKKNKRGAPTLEPGKLTVWDAPVRLLHWSLVAAMAAAWVTSDQVGVAHEYIGYGAAAIVLARLAWGFAGNRYARFARFVRPPAPTVQYLRAVARGRAARHIGHNPLGGWMVVALLACVALLAVSGWALGTDLLWGYAWPVRVHAALAWLLVALVTLHVGGVLLTSWQHRENLVGAMITGKKNPPAEGDLD